MAIVTQTYRSHEIQIGYAVESTFGTAIADDQNFTSLVEFDSISINHGVFQDLSSKRRGSVPHRYNEDAYVSETGMLREITINNLILRKLDLPIFLYALFQNVSEAVGDPYQKDYTFPTTITDIGGSNGMFFTFGIDAHIASYDEKYTSCIVRNMTLKADRTAEDGRLMADITLISGFAGSDTANFSGTWSPSAQAYFNMHKSSNDQIDDTDIVPYSWEITIDNKAVRGGGDSNGDAEYYHMLDEDADFDLNLSCKYDSAVQAELAAFRAGTETKFELGIGTGGTDGDFAFSSYGHYTDHQRISNERGSGLNIPVNCGYDNTGSNAPTISVADGQDRSW